jgi:lipoprotein signal peptidase
MKHVWENGAAFSFAGKQISNFLILYTIAFCFGGKNMIE